MKVTIPNWWVAKDPDSYAGGKWHLFYKEPILVCTMGSWSDEGKSNIEVEVEGYEGEWRNSAHKLDGEKWIQISNPHVRKELEKGLKVMDLP